MPKDLSDINKEKKKIWRIIIGIGVLMVVFALSMMQFGLAQARWGGITIHNLDPNLAAELAIPPTESGVVVISVNDSAFLSGVREGDLIKGINSRRVKNVKEFLKITKLSSLENGVLLDILRHGAPLYVSLTNTGFASGGMGNMMGIQQGMATAALTMPMNPGVKLPTPKQQNSAQKMIVEGHWNGMELIPLTGPMAALYKIPINIRGVLVDEITLSSAETGILAGDMLLAVNGIATPHLQALETATRKVQNRLTVPVLVSRKGVLLKFNMSSNKPLGFSQSEAAQPIIPGAVSPHNNLKKPCTACHIFMRNGGQVPKDMGDPLLPNPPPITKKDVMPHAFRGKCNICHVILK